MLFITFTWCSTIDSLTTLIMTKAYTVDSSCRAFAKSFAMNNLNADWQQDLSVWNADYEFSTSYACQKSWTISSTEQ